MLAIQRDVYKSAYIFYMAEMFMAKCWHVAQQHQQNDEDNEEK